MINTKKLIKFGSSWAILIPKDILDWIKIDPENDELEIEDKEENKARYIIIRKRK